MKQNAISITNKFLPALVLRFLLDRSKRRGRSTHTTATTKKTVLLLYRIPNLYAKQIDVIEFG